MRSGRRHLMKAYMSMILESHIFGVVSETGVFGLVESQGFW